MRLNLHFFHQFYRENPALLYGLHFLLGCSTALHPHWAFAATFALLWIPVFLFNVDRRPLLVKLLSCTTLSIAAFFYTQSQYPRCHLEKSEGLAYFSISSVKESQSPFFRSYQFRGKIKHFTSQSGETALELPCDIYFPLHGKRPLAHCDYLIQGRLQKKSDYHYIFKPTKDAEWTPIEKTWSLAQWRFQMKTHFNHYLKKHIPNAKARSFLSALIIGELDDRTMSLEFSRLGLQHILGVSGFQFVLLSALFTLVFRLILPFRLAILLSLACLTAYYFFIGHSPPVQRAWIAIFLFLLTRLTTLRITSLNAFGVALFLQPLIDPLEITNIGFQLSFLCTAAILLLYPTINSWFSLLLPKRTFSEVKALNPLDQHGYLLSALIRETLALNLSVHLFAFPALIALFHKFPFFSFFYNLVFPFCLSLTFLFFAISCCLPFIGPYCHLANTKFLTLLLNYSSHPPAIYDFAIRLNHIPFAAIILSISFLFLFSLFLTYQKRETLLERQL